MMTRTLPLVLGLCLALSCADPAGGQEGAPDPAVARARAVIERNRKLAVKAPDFGAGRRWLNVSRPLTLAGDFSGRVVLLDFWTYCCINCMHVIPDLEYLERKYGDRPFSVVGVHSAKFANESEEANIRQAVLRYGIHHPVVVDENFEIWRSYSVSSWPTMILIGPDGTVLAQLTGEGNRKTLDALVGAALAVYGREKGALNPRPIPVRLEAARELARELSFPGKVAVDPAGEKLYISDSDHDRIVVTTLDGRFVRAVAPASGIRFRHPQGLAFYRGDLLVADTENHSIERVDGKTGAVTRIAGTGEQGWTRSGTFPATKVALSSPWDLLVDGDDLYVAMAGPHQIWRMDLEAGTIGAFAGSGREARVDGAFASACFAQPSGLARHGSKIYVAGSESSSIRVLDLGEGVVTTLAGGDRKSESLFHFGDEDGRGFGRRFQHPLGVAFAGGKLYVADTYNHKVKQVDPEDGNVVTIAGTGAPGYRDGPGASAQFYEPGGLAAGDGKLYVADTDNHVIRVVDLATRAVSTLALTGVPVPMPPAAAGSTAVDTGPLPDLPGTVDRKVEGKLPAGDATLTIDLSLPEGADLSPGAPAQYRVLTVSGAVRATAPGGRISEEKTGIPLTVNGPGELEVRAVYYWCDPSGTCSIRSVRWRVAVAADPSAPAALVVTDSPGRQRR